jgi:coenzyme F420-0:L-glutamate ligase/coenzyme F420-1:gamma-L-glutamate ligase
MHGEVPRFVTCRMVLHQGGSREYRGAATQLPPIRPATVARPGSAGFEENPARMPTPADLALHVLPGIPLIEAGDDLAAIVHDAIARLDLAPEDGDVLVLAQKVISKAEGRLIRLADVEPSAQAQELARETDKDPRLVQLILDESSEVVRKRPGMLLVRHRLGNVGAHAGIDQSNVDHGDGEAALLLPVDPDASAARLHEDLLARTGRRIAVIIADSMNRAWRLGTIGGAIGCAGLLVLDDRRGSHDMFGRELKVTLVNRADSLAAAASLLMGESVERTPAVLIKGLPWAPSAQTARDIIRPLAEDLFR